MSENVNEVSEFISTLLVGGALLAALDDQGQGENPGTGFTRCNKCPQQTGYPLTVAWTQSDLIYVNFIINLLIHTYTHTDTHTAFEIIIGIP